MELGAHDFVKRKDPVTKRYVEYNPILSNTRNIHAQEESRVKHAKMWGGFIFG